MKRFGFILLMLTALVLSCTREPSPGPDSSEVGFKTIHYKVQVSSYDDSKATTADNDTKYVFQATDSLYVTSTVTDPESGDPLLFGVLKLISGSGATTAYFEGDLVDVNEFEPAPDTPINVTLVSSGDRIHKTARGKLTGTAYPSNEYGTSLADAVQKFSHFTCSTTFGNTRFTLTQQSAFLVFTVSFKRTEVAVSTPVTAKVFNNNEANPIRQVSGVTATALGNARSRVDFVVAFPGGSTSLTDAELSVKWGDGENNHKEFAINDKVLAVNNYYTVSRTTIDLGNPFHIRAKEDGTTNVTFKYTYATGGIQYICYDLGVDDWTNYDGSSLPLSQDYVVYFKGTRQECYCAGDTQLFTADQVCYIGGKITSLTNGVMATNAFRSAFSKGSVSDSDLEKEKNISVASGTVGWVDIDPGDPLILPETTAANCYMEMFLGCTSLHSAPDLPATELADKCYFRMFYGCPISSIPAFPSVVTMSGTSNRRRYCFQMFQSCTKIERLEGSLFGGTMTLEANCFEDMFANCTGLKFVDEDFLPATTLAESCYRGMFQSTAITSAPNLLAPELVPNCYRFMFNNCKSLSYIKCYNTTNVTSDSYTQNWLQNAKSSGEFHYRSGVTWYINNNNGIPSGWTPVADTVQ